MIPKFLTCANREVNGSTRHVTLEPQDIDGVRVLINEGGEAKFSSSIVHYEDLMPWLEEPLSTMRDPALASRSSFLLGPAVFPRIPWQLRDWHPSRVLPVSSTTLQLLKAKFGLPEATDWLLETDSTHFHQHLSENANYAGKTLGFTMRMFSLGILGLDVCASISYCPESGHIVALLQGCCEGEQREVRRQLKSLSWLGAHPLLLPLVLVILRRELIQAEGSELWGLLLEVETLSGQTGAPVVLAENSQLSDSDFPSITHDVLGVLQRVTYAETQTNALLLTIEAMLESFDDINNAADPSQKSHVARTGAAIAQRLRLLAQQTCVMLGDARFLEKRAQAQQAAVYNYIAQRDARNSTLIAHATKRDSSSMKGIAVLTMLFLPATFLASFFAMPILDFAPDARLPSTKQAFWLYWAVSIPLTVVVMASYISYQTYVERKRREEDSEISSRASASGASPKVMVSKKPPPTLAGVAGGIVARVTRLHAR